MTGVTLYNVACKEPKLSCYSLWCLPCLQGAIQDKIIHPEKSFQPYHWTWRNCLLAACANEVCPCFIPYYQSTGADTYTTAYPELPCMLFCPCIVTARNAKVLEERTSAISAVVDNQPAAQPTTDQSTQLLF